MTTFKQLLAEIDAHHYHEPCTDPSAIETFERLYGHQLPGDLKEFYRRYETVKLFDGEYGAAYRFVPVSEIHPTRIDVYGKNEDEYGPDDWLTICDVLDGNYIAFDLTSKNGNEFNFIDCFHETFARPGECTIIAKTFTELLERALKSGGHLYYIGRDFSDYGDGRPLTAENAAIRIGNPEAPRKGWIARFAIREKNKIYDKFFADDDYGGKEGSFEAVKRFVDKCRNELA